jgi:hypothetical protein
MTAQKQALERFGIKAQTVKLAEECAELGAAALHSLERETPEALEKLFEECADVEIMLEQMRLHFGDTEIDAWRAKKLTRLEKRLGLGLREFSAPHPAVRSPKIDKALKAGSSAKTADSQIHSTKRRSVYVDGVEFKSIRSAAETFGLGIVVALRKGKKFKGHAVSFDAAIARAEA